MNKPVTPSPWDDTVDASEIDTPKETKATKTSSTKASTTKATPVSPTKAHEVEPLFDLEGLMTDFPTAKELEKFVFDQTGFVLNLKGRSNKFKYQTAMDVLNGAEPDSALMGTENPYLDKNELIPTETLRVLPPPDAEILAAGPVINKFDTNLFPHPDPDWKAQDQNCQVSFKKYANGIITYEILGPIALRAVGTRVNKFGKDQPEKFVWVDPRTGEQIIKRVDGSFTPLGTKLRAFMRRQRMNNSNQWDVWVDRDFVAPDTVINDNPWA
jgi:hypothetical protein